MNAEGIGGEAQAAPRIDAGVPSLPIFKMAAPPVLASAASEVTAGEISPIDAAPQLLTDVAQVDTLVDSAAVASAAPAAASASELAIDRWEAWRANTS